MLEEDGTHEEVLEREGMKIDLIVEVGRDILPYLRNWKDHAGRFFWSIGDIRDGIQNPKHGYLCGYEIRVVDGDGLRFSVVINEIAI